MQKIRSFFAYFFGMGKENIVDGVNEGVEFKNFTLIHFIPILLCAGIVFLIWRYRDKLRDMKHEKAFRMFLAFVAIVTEMSYFWRLACLPELGGNAAEHLPITICGWAVVFCSYLAVTKSQSLFDIAYFWVFSGTVFGVLMPTVITYTGVTRFRFYQFWLEHTIGYIIIFYMIFVHKMRPTWKSFAKSAGAMSILLVIAVFVNKMLGSPANYLFVAEPEPTKSLLDYLPKNDFLRIALMTSIILFMFCLAYLPWHLKDLRAKKRATTEGAPADAAPETGTDAAPDTAGTEETPTPAVEEVEATQETPV